MQSFIRRHIPQDILHLYQHYGHKQYFIGESLSIYNHSIKTAELMRNMKNVTDNNIIAAFLHDYGHIVQQTFTNPLITNHDEQHELVGAQALRLRGFSEQIVRPIELHVMAKRYLLTKNPSYSVTPASLKSFELQGGYLTESECVSFENDPYFHDSLNLRYCDDNGKE